MIADQSILKKKTRLTPLEKHVGKQLFLRRTLLNITQKDIAEAIGVTFQQIQKYENGSNRVSSGTLFLISQVLRTPINFFYEGYENISSSAASLAGFAEPPQEAISYAGQGRKKKNKEILAFFSDFYQKADENVRCEFRRIIEDEDAPKEEDTCCTRIRKIEETRI